MSAVQLLGAVLLVVSLVLAFWSFVSWLASYNVRIITAGKPTVRAFPPQPTTYLRDLRHDETDPLFDVRPQTLAVRFGVRAVDEMRTGRDPFCSAMLAAHFARQAYPMLTPPPSTIVHVMVFPGGTRRPMTVERIY